MKNVLAYFTSTVLIAGLLVVISPAVAAHADVYDDLHARWAAMVLGGPDMLSGGASPDLSDPLVVEYINRVDAAANSAWSTMDDTPGSWLWSDADFSTANVAQERQWPYEISQSYRRLKAMAIAYSTDGSSLEGSASLLADIKIGLQWLYTTKYYTGAALRDDWFEWQVGTPLSLNDIMVVLDDELTSTQISNYTAAIASFIPAVNKTGANRVWQSLVIAVRGIIIESSAEIEKGRDGLTAVFTNVSEDDGFYADGGFIQHDRHPYTAGYGRVPFVTIADLMHLLAGTPWAVVHANSVRIYEWAYNSFDPIIFRNSQMTAFAGRLFTNRTSEDGTHKIVFAFVRLAEASQTTNPARAADLLSIVKGWLVSDTYNNAINTATPEMIDKLRAIIDDPSIPARPGLVTFQNFASMDRAVQHRPSYAFAVSMHSTRIYNYEKHPTDGENPFGWHMGDGMTYLYTGDLGQYAGNYWPTVDYHRLAGTTVIIGGAKVGASKLSDQHWVGGAELGQFGSVGMRLHPYGLSLLAKKSWFFFDDEMVALGAEISASGLVETIIDNRKINSAGTDDLTVDNQVQGESMGWTGSFADADWAHLASTHSGGAIGYYFPGGMDIRADRKVETGAWSDIDTVPGLDDTVETNTFVTMSTHHGGNPTNGSYAYVVLPGKSKADTNSYSSNPDIIVLANTPNVQAAEDEGEGLLGANFWTVGPNTAGDLTVTGKASVIIDEDADQLAIGVSDPTQSGVGTIRVELARTATGVLEAGSRVNVIQLAPTIILDIDMSGAKGGTIPVVLDLSAPASEWDVVDDTMDAYSAGWTVTGSGGAAGTQGAGFATISDNGGGYGYFTRNGFTAPSGAFTMEARLRVTAGTQAEVSVRSGTYNASFFLNRSTTGSVQDRTSSPTKTFALDTTVWHDYRVVMHSNTTYDLYVDGVLAWSGATSLAGGTDMVKLGSGNTPTATLQVDAVRMRTGEHPPAGGAPTWNRIDDSMDAYTTGWSITGSTGSATQQTGYAQFLDASGSLYGYLTLNGFTAPTGAFTVESRLRMAGGTTGEISVRSGTYNAQFFLVRGTTGVVQDRETSPTKTFALDTTVWHDYRVVMHSNWTYDLYVDGVLAWSGATSGPTGTALVKLGSSNASTSRIDIDTFKLADGEFVP